MTFKKKEAVIEKIKGTVRKIINLSLFRLIKITRTEFRALDAQESQNENPHGLKEYNKLSNSYKKYTDIKLHFGCGGRILKGWINIDLFYGPFEKYIKYFPVDTYPENCDLRGDKNDFFAFDILKTGLPFPDNSVDIIFHEDFIEHLNQKEQIIFLAETFRVLKVGAVHRINTPDLVKSMRDNSNFSTGREGVYTDEWDKHIHKNVLSPEYLKEISKMIGYSEVIINSKDKSISKKIPKEYRPTLGSRSEDGNIFADLIK